MRQTLLFLCLLPLLTHAQTQKIEQFSEVRAEFISQLESYMTSSKQKAMEDTYREFATVFKGGMFSDPEVDQILKTGNRMLKHGMSANPYFSTYLKALAHVKKAEKGEQRFQEWHRVLDTMLSGAENSRMTSFQRFLDFSNQFFETGALQKETAGTSWFALSEDYKWGFDGKSPYLEYPKLDLMATWKADSIFIYQTSGRFFPVEEIWRGKEGRVTWERFGWDKDTYVELPQYELDIKRSLYEAKKAKLHYPLYFGSRVIEGDFSDKLTVDNAATEGSYPRFQSYEEVLELDNIGPGIKYIGGFRLHGTTIYGYGSKELPARLRILDDKGSLSFRANSELFTIRREERIVGERVEAVFYFGKDSIYHPSVNVRFDIKKREMELSRGDRGSDRNPFFSSIHEVNLDADRIYAYLDRDSVVIGQRTVPIVRKPEVFFESHQYFNEGDYRRIQNIASTNPIAIMKVTVEKEGTRFINANLLAERINSKFTVDNIQSLLYDLASKGFINYDSDKQMIEVKDKVFLYADAAQGKVDYDYLRIRSNSDSTNAVLNLKDNTMDIDGVKNIEFSNRQKVAILPDKQQVRLKPNRDMDLSGKLYAGFGILQGKGFHFNYERFQIGLDSIDYFDLYVPTGEFDENRNPKAVGIGSRIEDLSGVLLIDAPANKSGRQDIVMFPSLQSKKKSYVFYEASQDSVYSRDSFFFELKPFSFNHLDAFTAKDIQFGGKLVSGGVFPDIEETLTLQQDTSLGFTTKTPAEGLPNYRGKGQYSGDINLSNKGLTGKGVQQYLDASIEAKDIIFRPGEMQASAEEFNLEENRKKDVPVPQVRGKDITIQWRPYKDSMYVKPKSAPFALFKDNNHTLAGTLILTPGGLRGDGLLDWDKANMRSKYLEFGAYSVKADTTEVGIRAFNTKELALQTSNVKGEVDFDKQVGNFKANDEFLETVLPYNQYQTSMNEFDWSMKEETITFRTKPGRLGQFVSIHPDQDSLRFQGADAFYDLKTNALKIGGVPSIIAADAFIYPDSGKVDIKPGGVMTTLENARIVADTVTKHHVINRATVTIQGRKEYRAKGFYEYNIGDRKQEIEFANISGTRVGKGAASEKRVATRATGEVTEDLTFYIDHKTEFKGTISLQSESKNLQFDGFARLDADKLPERNWFTVKSEGDKQDLAIGFNSPKSFEGYPLENGLFLSKETSQAYPRVMMPLLFRGDRPIFNVKGVFKYNQKKDEFIFGDSSRVLRNELVGNRLVFNNAKGTIQGEGKFSIGSGLKYVSVDAAGRFSTSFPPVTDTTVVTDQDTSLAAGPQFMPVNFDMMAGIRLIVPDKLLKILITDIQSATFDAKPINYLGDIEFFKKTVYDMFPADQNVKEAAEAMSSGFLDLPAKYNNYTFLFSPLKMKWDADYQSLVSTDASRIGLVSIAGTSINKSMTCYLEFKMQSNEDDRLYVYIKSPSELYYFFGYKQGILSITSNNPTFMTELEGMKAKDLVMKMDDGETFEIQVVEPGTATMFLRRMQAVGK